MSAPELPSRRSYKGRLEAQFAGRSRSRRNVRSLFAPRGIRLRNGQSAVPLKPGQPILRHRVGCAVALKKICVDLGALLLGYNVGKPSGMLDQRVVPACRVANVFFQAVGFRIELE